MSHDCAFCFCNIITSQKAAIQETSLFNHCLYAFMTCWCVMVLRIFHAAQATLESKSKTSFLFFFGLFFDRIVYRKCPLSPKTPVYQVCSCTQQEYYITIFTDIFFFIHSTLNHSVPSFFFLKEDKARCSFKAITSLNIKKGSFIFHHESFFKVDLCICKVQKWRLSIQSATCYYVTTDNI